MTDPAHPPLTRMVTVSATYGAGGSVIAPLLAERLGLPFADRLIPARNRDEEPAAEEGLNEVERRQFRGRRLLERLVQLAPGMNLPTPDETDLGGQLRARVAQSLRVLVDEGGAVVLGRAGAVLLAELPGAFHVRLDGPPDRRCAIGAAFEGIDPERARDRLEETDRARTGYVQRLYDRNPADPSLYHLVLDTTVLDAGDSVDILATAALAYWRRLR